MIPSFLTKSTKTAQNSLEMAKNGQKNTQSKKRDNPFENHKNPNKEEKTLLWGRNHQGGSSKTGL